MKFRIIGLLLLFLAILSFTGTGFSQDDFEGKVTFNLTSDDGKTNTMDYYVMGDKIRFDADMEGHNGQIIMNTGTKQFMIIMPEQKMYMVMPVPEKEMSSKNHEGMGKNADFSNTGETKEILGYTAEKWIYKDEDKQGEAWLTKGIGTFKLLSNPMQNADKPQWQRELEGGGYFPLLVSENGKTVFEVTNIEKKSLDKSMFEPPAGFQKMDIPNMHN